MRKAETHFSSNARDFQKHTREVGNNAINANFIFPRICSLLLNFDHMMLVNMKLDVNGFKRITFQGYKLHWSS